MPEFMTQASMAAGEIAPHLYGRVDQGLYYIGMRTARNFIIRQYGGAANRPGKKFIGENKDHTKRTRLIPFQFNEEQTYMLEFGENYMRVIKDGAEVLESATAATVTGITQANPGVVTTSGAHGYSDGDDVYVTGVSGMVELNGRTLRVANKTATTFELTDSLDNNVDTTGYGAWTAGGTTTKIYTLTTTYTESELRDIRVASKNDTMTLVHKDHYPRDITRTAHDAWTIADFANTGGPFQEDNATATTVYASATTGSVTITASAALFTSAMVGELFYIRQEPDDATARWEVAAPIQPSDIRRAGSHYYKANHTEAAETITGITGANPAVVTVGAGHGIKQGDFVFITGVGGMTEVNDKYFTASRVTTTAVHLADIDTNANINSTSYNAYTSGGTLQKCKKTGTYRPDHTDGSGTDGAGGEAADSGVTWDYLHSGFGIVEITAFGSSTSVTATVINTLPDNVIGSGNTTDNWAMQAWSSVQGYPSAVAYHKQRMDFGGTTQEPNRIDMSHVKYRTAFGVSEPLLDSESITMYLNTTGANVIRHLLPLSELIVLTSASEHLINGPDDALLATGTITNKFQGETGASEVAPIIINDTAIFVQDMGSSVRSLKYQLESDSFGGIDLTARSPHLFENKNIVEWGYQRYPYSLIWAVMSDGSLNSLTFMPEQEVYAWSRHDSGDAEYESVGCIREGNETAAYFKVKRTINGNTVRYTERLASRYFTDVKDACFVDSGLSYDGRNTSATTMTITGGSTWSYPETLTLTASTDTFLATDVGNWIVYWIGDLAYRLEITAYTSPTVVSVVPHRDITAAYQGVAFTNWEFAKKVFQPLHHLEGETVSILSDGNVVEDLVVTDGKVTLTSPGAVVHIGLPYVSDLETLDIAGPQGQLKGATFNVPRVLLTVQDSRAVFVSTEGLAADDSLTDLNGQAIAEIKQRDPSLGYDAPIPAETDVFEVVTSSSWSRKGRVAIRQTYPLPITVNAITAEVERGTN